MSTMFMRCHTCMVVAVTPEKGQEMLFTMTRTNEITGGWGHLAEIKF